MKNIALTVIAMAALGAMGTTPAYASGGGGSTWLCGLPIIGKLLCPPPPAVATAEPRSLSPLR